MIYTFGDEMHANARGYTIAFAMDKTFDKSKLVEFLYVWDEICRANFLENCTKKTIKA